MDRYIFIKWVLIIGVKWKIKIQSSTATGKQTQKEYYAAREIFLTSV